MKLNCCVAKMTIFNKQKKIKSREKHIKLTQTPNTHKFSTVIQDDKCFNQLHQQSRENAFRGVPQKRGKSYFLSNSMTTLKKCVRIPLRRRKQQSEDKLERVGGKVAAAAIIPFTCLTLNRKNIIEKCAYNYNLENVPCLAEIKTHIFLSLSPNLNNF